MGVYFYKLICRYNGAVLPPPCFAAVVVGKEGLSLYVNCVSCFMAEIGGSGPPLGMEGRGKIISSYRYFLTQHVILISVVLFAHLKIILCASGRRTVHEWLLWTSSTPGHVPHTSIGRSLRPWLAGVTWTWALGCLHGGQNRPINL